MKRTSIQIGRMNTDMGNIGFYLEGDRCIERDSISYEP